MSIDTKPSPELNLAVAGAAGIDAFIFDGECLEHTDRPTLVEPFSPSSDLNDAMEAADRVFPGGWVFSKESRAPEHLRFNFKPPISRDAAYDPGDFGSSGPTGPLAICAAILKSKAKTSA